MVSQFRRKKLQIEHYHGSTLPWLCVLQGTFNLIWHLFPILFWSVSHSPKKATYTFHSPPPLILSLPSLQALAQHISVPPSYYFYRVSLDCLFDQHCNKRRLATIPHFLSICSFDLSQWVASQGGWGCLEAMDMGRQYWINHENLALLGLHPSKVRL